MKRTITSAAALAIATLLAIGALASCQSLQRDVIVSSSDEADYALLDSIDEQIARYRAYAIRADLDRARELLADAKKRTILNDAWNARLIGMEGEIALLSGDTGGARRAAETLAKLAPNEERKWLLEAWLADTPEKARAILEEGKSKADTNARIVAELGMLALARGEWREALALFDDALPSLSSAWKAVYQDDRDSAYKLRDSGRVSLRSADYLTSAPITYLGMVTIALGETSLLAGMTGGAPATPASLLESLQAAKWFGEDVLADDVATRKDVALFLWRAISEKKRQPELLTKYSKRFAGRASPIPDVPVDAFWFDSALGCVEWSVMSLIDGKNFVPFELVSGFDFYDMAKKADAK
jgi:tetratricopeptide (TPR) repeat protein